MSRQRSSPFSSSIASGAPPPASRSSSGVCAFEPTGCECRKTATTACSISRPGESAPYSRWTSRALANSASSSGTHWVLLPSTLSMVAGFASSPMACETVAAPGSARRAAGPTSGLGSQRSASRRAMASVRRIPRVRWNPSICVHRL